LPILSNSSAPRFTRFQDYPDSESGFKDDDGLNFSQGLKPPPSFPCRETAK